MNSREELFDASIVRLRQMYLEEKVNANPHFVLFENDICRIEERSFLEGAFCMSFPDCFQEVTREIFEDISCPDETVPIAVIRSPSGNMSASFYQLFQYPEEESISDTFIRLFSEKIIDYKGVCMAKNCDVYWFDYRKTSGPVLSYTLVFSFPIQDSLIIGQMSCHLKEYEPCKKLMKRLLGTVEIRKEEENERN